MARKLLGTAKTEISFAERVTLAKDLDRKFRRFADTEAMRSEPWLWIVREWLRSMGDKVTGLYGEGSPIEVNTYNGEDLLSQVIQFTLFRIDFTDYVALQIHGGCDVRGGYTAPRIFEVNGDGIAGTVAALVIAGIA